MVSVGGNLYSVPDTTRKRVLEVQSHASEIRVFEEGYLIARHPVLEGRNLRRVDRGHRKAPPPSRKSGSALQGSGRPLGEHVGRRSLTFYDTVSASENSGFFSSDGTQCSDIYPKLEIAFVISSVCPMATLLRSAWPLRRCGDE